MSIATITQRRRVGEARPGSQLHSIQRVHESWAARMASGHSTAGEALFKEPPSGSMTKSKNALTYQTPMSDTTPSRTPCLHRQFTNPICLALSRNIKNRPIATKLENKARIMTKSKQPNYLVAILQFIATIVTVYNLLGSALSQCPGSRGPLVLEGPGPPTRTPVLQKRELKEWTHIIPSLRWPH